MARIGEIIARCG